MLPVQSLPRFNSLLFCYFVSVVFICCKKDNIRSMVDNGKGNPTSYLLEQITDGGKGGMGGLDYYFEYNTDNQVSEIKRVQWGYVTYGNNPPVRQENAMTYSFEYVNKLPVKCTLIDDVFMWTFAYEYEGDRIVKNTVRYFGVNVQDSTFYSYDPHGNLGEAVLFKNNAKYKSEFTYGNDLITHTSYLLDVNLKQKYRSEYVAFDKKINFIRAINGLPATFIVDDISFYDHTSPGPGNNTQIKSSCIVGINDNFTSLNSVNYSYEYNEEGLPVRMDVNGLTSIFKYRKYK